MRAVRYAGFRRFGLGFGFLRPFPGWLGIAQYLLDAGELRFHKCGEIPVDVCGCGSRGHLGTLQGPRGRVNPPRAAEPPGRLEHTCCRLRQPCSKFEQQWRLPPHCRS